MNNIIVSAPGKLHLLGEHAVVYGKPAILASVAKRCQITLSPRTDKKIEIISQTIQKSIILSKEEIRKQTDHAQKQWELFAKTNNPKLLQNITANPLDYPILCIGETIAFYKKQLEQGFTLTIESEIPIGSGMGSSASLAVAIAQGVSLFVRQSLDKEHIKDIAFLAEQKKHGFPSGGDISACFYGDLVWYRKETPDLKIIQPIPFTLSEIVSKNFSTIFTGVPYESTGEMVSSVRSLYQEKQKATDAIFNEQEQLTRDLLTVLKNEQHEEIINIIREGEKNLEKLGVVSKYVQTIIRKIEKSGGAAKICGGGGKTKGTGTVLIYHTDKEKLKKILEKENFEVCDIMLGDEGIRIETEQ